MSKLYIETHGCQMNEYDSELIGWMMEQLHYAPTDEPESADVAIFNTCCIRDNADQKVYGRLGDFKLTDGTTKSPIFRRPHSFVLLEAFKIRAGKIQQIEAVFITVPYNMPTPWK